MKVSFCIVFLFFLFAGCDSKRVYEDNYDFHDRTWKIADSIKFEFQIPDSSRKYNVLMNIRNSIDYPYARIFVNYDLLNSIGSSLSHKMVSEYLFDQKTGKPFGSSGIGDIYDHQFPLLKNFLFEKPGTYKLKLNQFMRMDTIPGILAVGVRIENADEK